MLNYTEFLRGFRLTYYLIKFNQAKIRKSSLKEYEISYNQG